MKKSQQKSSKVMKYTKKQLENLQSESKTDYEKIDASSDSDIDYSDIPELDDKFWANAKVVDHGKKAISIRLDIDVLDWFKKQGGRYQKLINQVLRQYMDTHYRHR